MKTSILIASGLALMTGACAGPRPLTKLDCPPVQGGLTRVSAAPDGTSCLYRTPRGEILLRILAVQGDAYATLQALENALKAPAAGEAAPRPDAQAKTSAAEASIDAVPDGPPQRAEVDLPGLHIKADEDDATIQIGALKINANDDESTVRIYREVRLRGEALARVRRGLRATYVHSGNDLPNGYRFVGYEASGRRTGPLAVATLRSKLEAEPGEQTYSDVKTLVRRNGGA